MFVIKRLISLVILLAPLIVTAAGQSAPQKGVTGQKSSLKTEEAKQSNQNHEAAQKAAPPIAKQVNAAVSDSQPAKGGEDIEIQRKLARYTKWLVIVGAIQFVVLIAQAAVFWFTLHAINRQTLLSSDTAQRQLRAYVCVNSALLKFSQPEVPEVQIHLKNSGQTPAYEVRGWIHIWIEKYPLKISLPEPPEGFQKSKEIMGPGSTRTYVIAKKPPIPSQSLPLLGTTEGTIYAYGEVRYKDAFGGERYTKYRLIYGGSEGVRKSRPDAEGLVTALLKPDSDGNEAN